MGFDTMFEANRSTVLEKLKSLDDTDRMLLLNKYSRQTENTYCKFNAAQNIDIIIKIFMLKFNKDALIDAYMKGTRLSINQAADSMISCTTNF